MLLQVEIAQQAPIQGLRLLEARRQAATTATTVPLGARTYAALPPAVCKPASTQLATLQLAAFMAVQAFPARRYSTLEMSSLCQAAGWQGRLENGKELNLGSPAWHSVSKLRLLTCGPGSTSIC
jgi:hypothetical protein